MEQLKIVKTKSELRDLEVYLADKQYIAFDTETTGLDRESRVIGLSVCAEVETGYYVITAHWDVKQQKLIYTELNEDLGPLLSLLSKKDLIMQNAPFDCQMVNQNYGVDLMPAVHTDTLILGHLLNENRSNGLKERGIELYGEDAAAEQVAMRESVHRNGGMLTKQNYELYKADADLIAKYGAKDAILTLKIFLNDVPRLCEEGLDKFFYDDESMPLLKGPTYDMNITGLRVDPDKLQKLKAELQAECIEAKDFILKEVFPLVKKKYPGTGKTNHFNIGAPQQLAWLLFFELDNEFLTLTESGREMLKTLEEPIPYAPGAKRAFIRMCIERKGEIWKFGSCKDPHNKEHKCDDKCKDKKTGKKRLAKKIGDPWQYIACGKDTLARYSLKYKWVERLVEYRKNLKLLNTYVEGIQARMRYNIIRPNFLQHGTTSGRYSCKNPNFQNLPRDDRRVKACIVARPGKVFVGADYSQLEPRVFASVSGDTRLLKCFENEDDFYSVIGAETFNKKGCSLKKDDDDSFAKLYPMERHYSKQFGLAATYGAMAFRLSKITGLPVDEMEYALSRYFNRFPDVKQMMIAAHNEAKTTGRVLSLFGRPRRMPLAATITKNFPNMSDNDLPYEYRNLLNLAVNHKMQSTGASIMNRAAIKLWAACKELELQDKAWADVKIVMQVHDDLVLEGPESLKDEMKAVLKWSMETAARLPGVALVADPKIANNLADLK